LSQGSATLPAVRVGRVAALFDLSRGQQALLSIAQPGLGALLALGAMPSWRVVGLGLLAAVTGFFAVFSLNDVLDRDVDARSLAAGKDHFDGYDVDTTFLRHPLARGDLSFRFSLAWVISLGCVSAATAFVLRPACLPFFAAAVALEIVYCALRSVTYLKTIVSGAMVGVGGSAGWAAVAPLSWRAASFCAFLALWEVGGRNIANDLADLTSDAAVGIRTVTTTFGPRAAARATAAVAGATLLSVLALPLPLAARAAALLLGAWSMGWPAWALLKQPTSAQAGAYFNHASLYPALVLAVTLVAVAAH
jgi:4-hydroxybenzoate polyprenyltransferase